MFMSYQVQYSVYGHKIHYYLDKNLLIFRKLNFRNKKHEVDTRTPEELIAIIDMKGKEIEEVLENLRKTG